MVALSKLFTRSGTTPGETAPAEVIVLRSFGLVALLLFVLEKLTTRPEPALHGRGPFSMASAAATASSAASTSATTQKPSSSSAVRSPMRVAT